MHRGPNEPVNLSNDEELTVLEIAERIRELIGSRSELVFLPRPEDGPERRRPDLARALKEVRWTQRARLEDGLSWTLHKKGSDHPALRWNDLSSPL